MLLFHAVVAASPLAAQVPQSNAPDQPQAAYAAHHSDFDYLLGDWEFTAVSKERGESPTDRSSMSFASSATMAKPDS
jgi:hypothetical protein